MSNIYRTYNYRNPKKSRRKFPWLVVFIMIVITVFVLSSINSDFDTASNGQPVLTEEVPVEPKKLEPPYDFSSVEFPQQGQAAIGTKDFGVIRTSTDTEQVQPMASITKLVTALAVLEKSPLSPGDKGKEFVLTSQDEQYWHDYVAIQGTITPVTAGYSMTQYEALQAILLPSSNNIADTLVDNFFESKEDYLVFANSLMSSYGLENTKIADASGFSPDSVSTPSELIIIGQKILDNPVLAEIVAQPEANIAVAGQIPNYNPLIEIPNVTGIKPGATDEAGYCLIFSADINNPDGEQETIIGVVMGINDRAIYVNGSLKLLEDAKAVISQG